MNVVPIVLSNLFILFKQGVCPDSIKTMRYTTLIKPLVAIIIILMIEKSDYSLTLFVVYFNLFVLLKILKHK